MIVGYFNGDIEIWKKNYSISSSDRLNLSKSRFIKYKVKLLFPMNKMLYSHSYKIKKILCNEELNVIVSIDIKSKHKNNIQIQYQFIIWQMGSAGTP